eukprot:COSAG02_NODE_1453_length_12551_cov_2.557420_11_plen_351_part_00
MRNLLLLWLGTLLGAGSARSLKPERRTSNASAAVAVGGGGYPRGVQLLDGSWLICVNMDIHRSPAGGQGSEWAKISTILTDGREGVDLANCNLAQLPSGRVLASYRHHVPQTAGGMRYAIEVSASDDGGHSWRALSTMVSGAVGMWEPFLFPPMAVERRATTGGHDVIWAAYSQELTNGGLQSIVWQRSTDRGASWEAPITISDGREHHSRDGMPGITRLRDGSLLMVFEGFWDYFAHNTTERHHFSVQARRSFDEGNTWSEGALGRPSSLLLCDSGSPRHLSRVVPHFVTNIEHCCGECLGAVIFTPPKDAQGINAGAPQVIASGSSEEIFISVRWHAHSCSCHIRVLP